MPSFETPDGIFVELIGTGDVLVQVLCDRLNQTHFDGKLPRISAFAATEIVHPTVSPVHALTFMQSELPKQVELSTPWLIVIHETFCVLPFLAQLLLHEMTHVYLPDEQPHHSAKFWATLREKWLINSELVMGAGLNADETPKGLTLEFLQQRAIAQSVGFLSREDR